MRTARGTHPNHRGPLMRFAIVLGCFALVFVNAAAAGSDDFPQAITGTWAGEHCGKRPVTWSIQMSPANAYVREKSCRSNGCEEADYRITQVGMSDRRFSIVPHYIPKAPRTPYSFAVVVQYDPGGQRLLGTYFGHPTCQTVTLTKVHSDTVPPLRTSSSTSLPRPSATVSVAPPPPRSSSARASTDDFGRREPSYRCHDIYCEFTKGSERVCQRVCD